jgi:hypothetical protein
MHANFRRRLRPALGLATALLLPLLPLHAETAATNTFISAYEADLRLLYDEARAIGADNFVFYLHMQGDETAVRALAAELGANRNLTLHGRAGLQPQQMRAYATPAVLRDMLRKLRPGAVSPVFQPFKGQWALVELKAVATGQPMPAFAELRDSLLRLVGIRALPDAATLRARTPEQQESAQLARVATAGAFDQLPPGVDVNKQLSSGYTLLQRALREDNLDLVKALLTRHADPNRCYMDACPLQIALDSKTHALTYTNLLLEAGAKPDQLPGLPGDNTALVMACQRGQLDVVKALLAKGADATGKGSQLKPLDIALASGNLDLQRILLNKGLGAPDDKGAPSLLHVAMATGNRALAQTLLDQGADPLAHRPLPDSDQSGTPLAAALATGKAADAAWLRDVIAKKLAAKGRYRWAAWIEQEVLAPPSKDPNAPLVHILRQPFRNGARLTLNRERFTLHVRLHPEAELRMEAVTGPKFFDELGSGDLAAPLFDRKRIRSAGSRPGPLLVGDAGARAANSAATGGLLAFAPDRAHCDRVEKSPEGPVCVRIIDSVRIDRGTGEVELSLEKSGLRELDLVLGTAVDYSDTQGDLVNAQKVTLLFR